MFIYERDFSTSFALVSSLEEGISQKLSHKWIGPFEISKKLTDITYSLVTCDDKQPAGVWHVMRLKPYYERVNRIVKLPKPPPVEIPIKKRLRERKDINYKDILRKK